MNRPQIISPRLSAGDQEILASVGFPESFCDWFSQSERAILDTDDWRDLPIEWNGTTERCGTACTLARQDLGVFLLSCESGRILFAMDDGNGIGVNSSLYAFLFCVACYSQAARTDFRNVEEWLTRCRHCDSPAFSDSSSGWSVLFEEAAGGMF
jgi:hypothetical protein